MLRLLVLNGPNLNLLGTRQPEVYGATTLAEVDAMCMALEPELEAQITCVQSNHEGVLIDEIHACRGTRDGIVLNAGAYTHTSLALMDAIASVALPVVELHVSNIHAREDFRHKTYIGRVALGQICGFGTAGYPLALRALAGHLRSK